LSRCDSGVRSLVSAQGALACSPIHEFGTEEQRQRWLPRMATGELVGCFGPDRARLRERPGRMRTTAPGTATHWVLNGSKMWIPNGTQAHLARGLAQTGPCQESIRGLREEKAPGFRRREIEGKFSMRASTPRSLSLQTCECRWANRRCRDPRASSAPLSASRRRATDRLGRHRGATPPSPSTSGGAATTRWSPRPVRQGASRLPAHPKRSAAMLTEIRQGQRL
jgi:hypothetical protein